MSWSSQKDKDRIRIAKQGNKALRDSGLVHKLNSDTAREAAKVRWQRYYARKAAEKDLKESSNNEIQQELT